MTLSQILSLENLRTGDVEMEMTFTLTFLSCSGLSCYTVSKLFKFKMLLPEAFSLQPEKLIFRCELVQD